MAMQKLYAQGATMLELLAVHYNTQQTDPKMQRWVEQQQYDSNKKMEQNNWAAQFKVSTAIQLLEQEAAMCNAVVGSGDTPLG